MFKRHNKYMHEESASDSEEEGTKKYVPPPRVEPLQSVVTTDQLENESEESDLDDLKSYVCSSCPDAVLRSLKQVNRHIGSEEHAKNVEAARALGPSASQRKRKRRNAAKKKREKAKAMKKAIAKKEKEEKGEGEDNSNEEEGSTETKSSTSTPKKKEKTKKSKKVEKEKEEGKEEEGDKEKK
eukprot:TRINITY_DN4242_c0_g1_i1.p1 TRINITY_DN4242_c0_g1~~TRINITY_DN4242_c0_g1_i1.p1  ORF type:complete len:183 (+),score=87.07 TRINITY_DN4242_c0_g1_i1:68-616(+)